MVFNSLIGDLPAVFFEILANNVKEKMENYMNALYSSMLPLLIFSMESIINL